MPLRGLALLGFLILSVPVCFFRPLYGILLWTVIAFLNPQSFTWALETVNWALIVAIPTLAGMLVFDRKFERLSSPQVFWMVVLWLWFTVTTLVSVSTPEFMHHANETWYRWTFVSKILVMTLCTIPIVSSFVRFRYLVLTIAGCFGLYVLKSLPFVVLTRGAHRLYGPDRSMIADNNDFGLALNMTLPLFFFLAQSESNRWVKRFFAMMFVVTIPAIFFTYSRGALVGLMAVLLLMFLGSRRRWLLVPVIVIGAVIALTLTPDTWRQRMDFTRPEALDASARSRLNAWGYARSLAADYPITGGGFATFTPELYIRYGVELANVGPHSVYFQLLAEHGYVGLGLYLVLVLSCFATLRRLRKAARAQRDSDIDHYAHMFQFSLVGFLVSGLFLGRAYFDYFFTIVACVVMLRRLAQERWISHESAQPAPTSMPATALTTVPLR